jgi:hypothetical protein
MVRRGDEGNLAATRNGFRLEGEALVAGGDNLNCRAGSGHGGKAPKDGLEDARVRLQTHEAAQPGASGQRVAEWQGNAPRIASSERITGARSKPVLSQHPDIGSIRDHRPVLARVPLQ